MRNHVHSVRDYGAGFGGDDTTAIQAAIDAATVDDDEFAVGVVQFPTGSYRISSPIYVGYDFDTYPWRHHAGHFGKKYESVRPGARRKRVVLEGIGSATLLYTGPETDRYMLYYAPSTEWVGSETFRNLVFHCNRKSRGVFVYHPGYGCEVARNCRILYYRGIGLDAVACYGGTLTNLYAFGDGIGLRCVCHNSMTTTGGKLGTSLSKGAEIFELPEVDDTVSIPWYDDYQPTCKPEDQAALTILHSDCSTWETMCIEGVKASGRPATYSDARSRYNTIRGIRYEGISGADCLIRLDGGRNNLIENIHSTVHVDHMVELGPGATGNEIRMLDGTNVRKSVVYSYGPLYSYGNRLSNIKLRGEGNTAIPTITYRDDVLGHLNLIEGLPDEIPVLTNEIRPSVQEPLSYFHIRMRFPLYRTHPAAKVIRDLVDGLPGQQLTLLATNRVTLSGFLNGGERVSLRAGESIDLIRDGPGWMIPTKR